MSESSTQTTVKRMRCSVEDLHLIRDVIEGRKTLDDIPYGKRTFPLFLETLPFRQDIISWYPIKPDANVLEIGAGSGSVTALLCARASRVTALDQDGRLCALNRLRNRLCHNLTVTEGSLKALPDRDVYDLIFLNDVLPDAPDYTEGANPWRELLEDMRERLSGRGRCLVSLPNRYGIKYFSGAPDEKTGVYFAGMNPDRRPAGTRTFSRREIQNLLTDAGFPYLRFYYPYPDHLFPQKIYTDATITSFSYGSSYTCYEDSRVTLFPEGPVTRAAMREGIIPYLANSFLIEAATVPFEDSDTLIYVKMNRDRAKPYQVGTAIFERTGRDVDGEATPAAVQKTDNETGAEAVQKAGNEADGRIAGDRMVLRYALTSEASGHLSHMHTAENSFSLPGVTCLKGVMVPEGCRYPCLTGKTLLDLILDAAWHEDRDGIFTLLDDFFTACFAGRIRKHDWMTDDFRERFGDGSLSEEEPECVCPANIDLTCDNVFPEGKNYTIIDGEWIFDFPIPVRFIVWRSLDLLCDFNGHQLKGLVTRADLMSRYGISEDDENLFRGWNLHFTMNFVQSDLLSRYAVYQKPLSLNEVNKDTLVREVEASLFPDTGKGFGDEKLSQTFWMNDGTFRLTFTLPDKASVRHLRFDPAERSFCHCLVYLASAGGARRLEPYNASEITEKEDIFLTTDPSYLIDPEWLDGDTVTLFGCLRFPDDAQVAADIERWLTARKEQIRSLKKEVKHLRKEAGEREQLYNLVNSKDLQIIGLENQLSALENTRAVKMSRALHRLKSKITGRQA